MNEHDLGGLLAGLIGLLLFPVLLYCFWCGWGSVVWFFITGATRSAGC